MDLPSGFLHLLFLCVAAVALGCDPGDQAALLEFSRGLSPRPWSSAHASTDCCLWTGVNCTGDPSTPRASRRVVALKLANKGLTGTISGSLGRLSQLRSLDLSSNSLFGPIPESLFQARSLAFVHLSSNSLSGNLSDALGNLSNLKVFDVSSNKLSGSIPDVFQAFGEKLFHFVVNTNNFSGSLPAWLSTCTALSLLDVITGSVAMSQLEPCRFRGTISLTFFNVTAALTELRQCPNLIDLQLDGNFKGEVMPADVSWEFPGLKYLSMADSNISGYITAWLSKLSQLRVLDLSGNHLQGSIPTWLSKLSGLVALDLSRNHLQGSIPDMFGELKEMLVLDLSSNMLTGDIPLSIFFGQGNISEPPSTQDPNTFPLNGTQGRPLVNPAFTSIVRPPTLVRLPLWILAITY